MAPEGVRTVTIQVGGERVSGLWQTPQQPRAAFLFAHGAGAGMAHPFMASVAEGLADRGIATLRYQFLYRERGSRRPDSPALAHAVVRAAVAEMQTLSPELPLVAGGKSFGGRMTSQAQADSPLPSVRGLVFFGFPLHPAGKPGVDRAAHLEHVHVPMLFLQGTRDALADMRLMEPLAERLGARATLVLVPDADHSFHVPARTGRTDAEVREGMLTVFADWIDKVVAR